MSRLGFKASLISTVIISLILSLSIVSFFSYRLIKEQVETRLISDIRQSLNNESNSILELFNRAKEVVTSAAGLLEKKKTDTSEYPNFLALSAPVGGVTKLTMGFDDGASYSSKPSKKTFPGGVGIKSKYDPRTRSWYNEGKKITGASVSSPFFTKSGDPMVLVMHSIPKGIIAADLRFGNLTNELKALSEAEQTPSFIIDKSGLILASAIESVVEQENVFESPIKNLMSELISSKKDVVEYTLDGVETLFFAQKIPLVNDDYWYLILSVNKESAYEPVQSATIKLISILSVTAIISIILLLFVLKVIYAPILSLRELITDLSQGDGDLTQRLDVRSNDDIGQIATGINKFIEQLQIMMKEVCSATEQLSGRIEVIYGQSKENSVVLAQHATETEHIVAAVEELSSSALVVADHSSSAAAEANEAKNNSHHANDQLKQAQDKINMLAADILKAADDVKKMNQETGNIQSIVEVIGGIAEQTNLLALNASIEAARAGEQGRGFAVVADEVRALANRTQISTTEIGDAIANLQKQATGVVSSIDGTQITCDTTVEGAESVSIMLNTLSDHITEINNMNAEISNSSEEQSKVIQTVSRNITELHGMVEKLSTIGNGQYEEVRHISDINEKLGNMIGKFKL